MSQRSLIYPGQMKSGSNTPCVGFGQRRVYYVRQSVGMPKTIFSQVSRITSIQSLICRFAKPVQPPVAVTLLSLFVRLLRDAESGCVLCSVNPNPKCTTS